MILVSKEIYEIMHKDRKVARIDEKGYCKIYYKSFMPYNLYLEEDDDIDSLVNNITNFNYWCATRVLTLDWQRKSEDRRKAWSVEKTGNVEHIVSVQ